MKHLLKSLILNATDGGSPAQGQPAPAAVAPASPEPAAPGAAAAAPQAPSPTAPAPSSPPAQAPSTDRLARGFASLARREREIAQREEAIKARESGFQDPRSYAKKEPMKALEYLGLTLEDAVKAAAGTGQIDPRDSKISAIEAELKQMKAEREQREASEKEQSQKNAQQAKWNEIQDFVKGNAEKYEHTSGEGEAGVNLAYQVVAEFYRIHGKILSVEEAVLATENYLDNHVNKILSRKKVQSRFAPKAPETPQPKEGSPAPKSNTLTPNMSAAPKPAVEGVTYKMPAREAEIMEAAKLIRFNR